MAAVRPIVLVYQDFASVSIPVALPSLNCMVVGPAYYIQDYATDKDAAFTVAIGDATTHPTGSAFSGLILTSHLLPSVPVGAVVDTSSVVVFLDSVLAELAFGADGAITTNANTLVSSGADFVTAGVQAGDRVVVGDIDSGSSGVYVAKTVLAVTNATTLTLTTNFTTAGTDVSGNAYTGLTLATSGLNYRVERPLSNVKPTSSSAFTATTSHISSSSTIKVNVNGSELKVVAGNMYTQYRALRTDLGNADSVTTQADILAKIGRIDERNPLAVAAFVAMQNSNKKIQFLGVSGDDLNGNSDILTAHTTARDTINGQKDVYCIVPVTNDLATLTMWKTRVRALADPSISRFRVVIGSGILPTTLQVTPPTGTASGVTESVDANHFNLLDNTATFITSGVRIGDSVVISSTKYTVSAILSENRVTMAATGLVDNGSVTYSIQRTLTKDDQVASLSATTTSLKDSRLTMVWPDKCLVSGVVNAYTGTASVQSGVYLAAAVGGMVSGLPPHQGFTYLGLAGITQVIDSNMYFTDDQIDALGNAGWYVIVQDTATSIPYSQHELTTDTTTLESGELMVVKNFDYVSMTYRDALVGFLGVYNVIPETLDFLRAAFSAVTDQLKLQKFPKIGAPLLDASITSLAPLTSSKDRVELYGSVSIPRPLNRIGLHLTA